MKKFFGTDGIRGVANQELTPELALQLGRAVILGTFPGGRCWGHFQESPETPSEVSPKIRNASGGVPGLTPARILIGKDPRISSDMLEGALIAGILSTGAMAYAAGILPTPAISFLTRDEKFNLGIMISASHNPVEDNGIKIFSADGAKLSDARENEIEQRLNAQDPLPRPTGLHVGKRYDFPEARSRYLEHLLSKFPHSLTGFRIVLDCAHGAMSVVAPELFANLGAALFVLHGSPDGAHINVNCGATHLQPLQEAVRRDNADLGIAFDGDGDRAMFVTSTGDVFNGDHILASLALHWHQSKKLRGPVVTTLMANFGLEDFLRSKNITMIRTAVGDRYVFEEMQRQKANLGGEQSGHILMPDEAPTGDGCLTALKILAILIESGQKLTDLSKLVKAFPQRLVNVRIQKKEQFYHDEKIQKMIAEEAVKLQGRGRIVVRPSGTESLVRVMAEGPDLQELDAIIERVAKAIQIRLG